jgi:hypothetical protein
MNRSMLRGFWIWGVMLTLCPWLAACQEKPVKEKMISVTVYGYNHRDTEIVFIVSEGGSGVISAHSQSGGSCCLSVPLNWRPGITVQVEWRPDLKQWNRQVVTVPEYDGKSSTRISVHFLRDGNIKAFVNRYALGHPDYPLKGEEAGFWEPGKSPYEIWEKGRNGNLEEKVDGFTSLFVHNGGTFAAVRPGFKDFVRRQLQLADKYAIRDWESQDRFVWMATYTNGGFVNESMVRDWLNKKERVQTFKEFSESVPEDIYDRYPAFPGNQEESMEKVQ